MSGARIPSAVRGAAAAGAAQQFAADVQYYLKQDPRQLPSCYLYDALGSALFEAICRLPWYPITRAEGRLLARHGGDILGRVAPLTAIVELGSGSGDKLRLLLESGVGASDPLDVHLVDISTSALESAARMLESIPHVRVTTHAAPYESGLQAARARLEAEAGVLVLFLGSNIGNFDPPGTHAFLRGVRSQLRPGDALLLGADLVKPERELRLAYDDPLGVTAAFNRNLLVRINRELGGDFEVARFGHRAEWNAAASRVEMHLVASGAQQVRVEAAQIAFTMRDGDRIWTESSYKYRPDEIVGLLDAAGFRLNAQWLDTADRFALTLGQAV